MPSGIPPGQGASQVEINEVQLQISAGGVTRADRSDPFIVHSYEVNGGLWLSRLTLIVFQGICAPVQAPFERCLASTGIACRSGPGSNVRWCGSSLHSSIGGPFGFIINDEGRGVTAGGAPDRTGSFMTSKRGSEGLGVADGLERRQIS